MIVAASLRGERRTRRFAAGFAHEVSVVSLDSCRSGPSGTADGRAGTDAFAGTLPLRVRTPHPQTTRPKRPARLVGRAMGLTGEVGLARELGSASGPAVTLARRPERAVCAKARAERADRDEPVVIERPRPQSADYGLCLERLSREARRKLGCAATVLPGRPVLEVIRRRGTVGVDLATQPPSAGPNRRR